MFKQELKHLKSESVSRPELTGVKTNPIVKKVESLKSSDTSLHQNPNVSQSSHKKGYVSPVAHDKPFKIKGLFNSKIRQNPNVSKLNQKTSHTSAFGRTKFDLTNRSWRRLRPLISKKPKIPRYNTTFKPDVELTVQEPNMPKEIENSNFTWLQSKPVNENYVNKKYSPRIPVPICNQKVNASNEKSESENFDMEKSIYLDNELFEQKKLEWKLRDELHKEKMSNLQEEINKSVARLKPLFMMNEDLNRLNIKYKLDSLSTTKN